jgi:hypothetical protein
VNNPTYEVKLLGVKEDIKAFQQLAPELKKELDKEIKSVLRPVLVQAQSYYPATDQVRPSGWRKGGTKRFNGIGPLAPDQTRGFLAYDGSKAKAGLRTVTPRTKKGSFGFTGFYGIVQRDPGGAIFETAGRGSAQSRSRSKTSSSRNPNASRDFIQAIEKYHGVLPTAKRDGNDKGRALIKSFDMNKGRIFGQVRDALRKTIAKSQTKLDSNKEV